MEENKIMENETPIIEGEIVDTEDVSECGSGAGLAVLLGGLAVVGLVAIGKKAIEGGKALVADARERIREKRALKSSVAVTEIIPDDIEKEE